MKLLKVSVILFKELFSNSFHQKVSLLSKTYEYFYIEKLAYTSPKNFIIGIFWLLWAILPSAAIGPLLLSLPAKSPLIAVAWRAQGSAFVMVISLTIYYIKYWKTANFWKDNSSYNLLKSFGLAMLLFVWNLGLIMGCSLTLGSHADVLYSSTGIYVLIFSLCTFKLVHKFEIYGYAVFSIGLLIMLTDPFATKTEGGNKFLGDLVIIHFLIIFRYHSVQPH